MLIFFTTKTKLRKSQLQIFVFLFGGIILPSLAIGQQLVVPTLLRSPITILSSFGTTSSKIGDAGTFTIQKAGSIIEITFNGRINVESLSGSDGAGFELRVDDTPSAYGSASAFFYVSDKPSPCCGIPASIKGIFSGLTPGIHTVNFWVSALLGSGTNATVAPMAIRGRVIILEHLAIQTGTFLPMIEK